jgi:GNAT superfamily N-acetyltransferase
VGHSACRKVRYSMLEPDAGKLARPVLGGGGAGNSTSLPDLIARVLSDVMPRPRLATSVDIPELARLIEQSVRTLSVGYYTGPQIESALLRYVFGPDAQLIADQTYYVVEGKSGDLMAAGGWSYRRTLYGGDQMNGTTGSLLDPTTEAARLRSFFVHPMWARRGMGRRLFDCCAAEAARAGFRTLELMATLPGEPFYLALGFVPLERTAVALPDGEMLPVVHMTRPLSAPMREPGFGGKLNIQPDRGGS